MTQQTNGMPDLNYTEENFRDLYEAGKQALSTLWVYFDLIKKNPEIDPRYTNLKHALAKADGK